jgi:hypothetical protein
MSDYQTAKIVYKKGLAAVMQKLSQLHNVRPEIHGSEINDWVCDAYRGSGLAETATTEKILRGLVEVGVTLKKDMCKPLTKTFRKRMDFRPISGLKLTKEKFNERS